MQVAVLGAGMMGHGIAQVFAEAGHDVRVHDQDPAALASVPERVRANLEALGASTACVERIALVDSLEAAVKGAEVVFEAVFEDVPLKQEVFRRVEAAAPADALIASNTSVLRIGDITARAQSRERMLGTHWWNPPHLVPLVEVVQAEGTADSAVERMMGLLAAVGKTPVHVRRDVPGFIGNRLQHALWREAFALVDEGVCDAATVDLVVKSSFGLRLSVLGPLENADLVGLDLTYAIHSYLLPHLSTAQEPARILAEKVRQGHLGMKSGEGTRPWTEAQARAVRERLAAHLIRLRREGGRHES